MVELVCLILILAVLLALASLVVGVFTLLGVYTSARGLIALSVVPWLVWLWRYVSFRRAPFQSYRAWHNRSRDFRDIACFMAIVSGVIWFIWLLNIADWWTR
jgi:hypothetical protein